MSSPSEISKPTVAYPNEYEAKLQARIRELEERLAQRPNNHLARVWHECLMKAEGMLYQQKKDLHELEDRITKAKAILTSIKEGDYCEDYVRRTLEALDGK